MTQVGCAGILVSDTFCGPMQELPREGQLLAVEAMPTKAGGCAANVAIDLIKQNLSVEVAGCLGKDASSRVVLSSLEEYGIGGSRIVYSDTLPTSKTVILLVAGQDRRYIHSFGANAGFTVSAIDREWVRSLQVFYLGGLFAMPGIQVPELLDLLAFCRQHGVTSVVDVVIAQNAAVSKDLVAPLVKLVDYFLPNEDEAFYMTGQTDPRQQLRTFQQWGANTVVITRGKQGAMAARGSAYWQSGIYEMKDVVDPSGCGDAFAAGLVAGIVQGWEMPDNLRYASALGASAIRALGTTDGVFTANQAAEFTRANHMEVIAGKL
jgi:sugar/nucleoside kinase (ribokinase family)